MERFSTFVLAHRRAISGFWLALFLVGVWASSTLANHLNQSFRIAGTPSQASTDAVVAQYHAGGDFDPLVPVFVLPSGVTPEAARASLEPALAAIPGRVVDYYNTGNPQFVGSDGRTMFALVFTPSTGDQVKDGKAQNNAVRVLPGELAGKAPPGTRVHVTGITPLSNNGSSGGGNGVLVEALLGGAGALIVLAFVFGSFLAVLPLVVAAVSILSSYLVVLLLTEVMKVQAVVQYMVGLIGLGVAIDYSLLLVTRWREEVAHGADNAAAVHRAMATAGRSVLVSGLTVALGLLSRIVVPIQFMRSIGIGGMLIPVVSVAVTLTLLPIVLTGFGHRMDWPHLRHEDKPSRAWTGWARLVVRRRWLAAGVALAVLITLAVTALGIHEGDPTTDSLAKSGDARQGLVALRAADVPSGALTPYMVLTPPNTQPTSLTPGNGLYAVVPVTVPPPGTEKTPTTRWPLTVVLPSDEAATRQGQHVAKLTRANLEQAIPGTLVVSSALANIDNIHKMYGQFPVLLAILAVLTFLVLSRTFRSLLLPAKAVLANLLSVAAAYGGMVLIWQKGYGSQAIWGIPATGGIPFWIPMIVFAFLYGLSMDYEVFILSRIREEHDAGADTDEAVVIGLGRTGRLVTSAALILFLAFAALASAPPTFLKIFATGLAIGILLDATVVRALLVPALVSLFGRWNWWLPGWAARILRVGPSP